MILDILKFPDPGLKQIADEVTAFDADLHTLLDNMAETMYSAHGIGLAATQVGKLLRLFVIDVGMQDGISGKLFEFINPKISEPEGSIAYEEACLSVPGVSEEVNRRQKVVVNFQNRMGSPQRMIVEGLLAVAVQHENDHLDGILFVDRLTPFKRRITKKKMEKALNF